MKGRLETGDLVRIMAGKHIGYRGTIVRWDLVQSGQLRIYPVVAIEHSGTEVRVLESSLKRWSEIVAEPVSE